MAHVILVREKAENGCLPHVCLRCGAPATVFQRKRIVWRAPLFAAEYLETILPFCLKHRNHFFLNSLFATAPFMLLFGFLISILTGSDILIWGFGLLSASFFAILAFRPGIRVEEITGWNITLSGVAQAFVRALVIQGYLEAKKSAPETSEGAETGDSLRLPKFPS